MKGKQVATTIEQAFHDLAAPKAEEMAEQNSWEYSDIRENFSGLLAMTPSSTDLNSRAVRNLLEWHSDSLPGFTPKGFHFFLQYYLLYSLQFPNSDVADYVVYHLADVDLSRHYWEVRYPLFSAKQKRSICDFLGYMMTQAEFSNSREVIGGGMDIWC